MITKQWAGHIYGTNTGDIYLEFDDPVDDLKLTGSLSIMDRHFGLGRYSVKGIFGDGLTLTGTPEKHKDGVDSGEIAVTAKLVEDGNLRGNWKSTLGTAGTFVAYPHALATRERAKASGDIAPEQFFTSRASIGALRLYAEGIKDLAEAITREFSSGKIVVTYAVRGSELTTYLETFYKTASTLGPLRRFKFHIQEPEEHGINRVITIDLNTAGSNEVMVQGINESWVIGRAEIIARVLRGYESGLVTNYKKFGLTLNQFIYLAMLAAIPSIEAFLDRAVFVVAVVVILQFLYWLHSKFIPVLIVYPSDPAASVWERLRPTALSWLIATSSAVAASGVFLLLTGKSGG